MKLYVVTKGEYSDYEIVCIFKNKKKAQNFLKYHGRDCFYDDMRIEEFSLSDDCYKIVTDGYYEYTASVQCIFYNKKFKVRNIDIRYHGLVEKCEHQSTNMSCYDNGFCMLHLVRGFRESEVTKKESKEKMKKIIIDIANQVNYYRSEGMSFSDISTLIEKENNNK